MNTLCMLSCLLLHDLRPLAVHESAEGQAVLPGRCEVGDIDPSVALSLLLTPGQQPARTHLRLCRRDIMYDQCQQGPVTLL